MPSIQFYSILKVSAITMHSHTGTKGTGYRTKNKLLHLARIITIRKVEFTLEQATKALEGVVLQLYPYTNLGARWK
jgi:hypothetical protein